MLKKIKTKGGLFLLKSHFYRHKPMNCISYNVLKKASLWNLNWKFVETEQNWSPAGAIHSMAFFLWENHFG